MAIPLNVNGAVFEYPENFDEAWGVNATGWAQAVTNGMLQRQGGNFPLTADVNFGASFGLVSLYYKSRSTPIATTGTLRLASADPGIAFRNNADSGNLILTTDSSNSLTYSSGMKLTGNLFLRNTAAVGFQDSGSSHTILMQSPSVNTQYSFVLPPNPGSAGQVLSTDGAGITTWINAAGGGTVNSGSQYQLAYYAANGATISGNGNITTNASNQFLVTDGTVSLPGYTFMGDTDAGIYRIGADDIAISTNGIKRLEVNTTTISSTLPIDVGSNKITSVANPTVAQDVATKNYVDTSAINQLTGDVTAGPGGGSQAATIATNAITAPKLASSAVTTAKIAINSITPQSTVGTASQYLGSSGFTVIDSTAISVDGAANGTMVLANVDIAITTNGSFQATVAIRVTLGGTVYNGCYSSVDITSHSAGDLVTLQIPICVVAPIVGSVSASLEYKVTNGTFFSVRNYNLSVIALNR